MRTMLEKYCAVQTCFELKGPIEVLHLCQHQHLTDRRRLGAGPEDEFSDSDDDGTHSDVPMDIDYHVSEPVTPFGRTLPPIIPNYDCFPPPPRFPPMIPVPDKATRTIHKQAVRRAKNAGTSWKSAKVAIQKLTRAQDEPVFTDIDLHTLNRSYTVEDRDASKACKRSEAGSNPKGGKGAKRIEKKVYKLEDLLKDGFTLIRWDGIKPKVILGKYGEIFVILAGRPNENDYLIDLQNTDKAMEKACDKLPALSEKKSPRRGRHIHVSAGISYGGGCKGPREMKIYSKRNERIVEEFEGLRGVQRLVGFADRSMETFAPDLWTFTKTTLDRFELENGIRRRFSGRPFTSTTYNLGPIVETFPHKDLKNLSFGLCAITSLGNYDYKKGGHLVLWELKLVIEFPPYSTILIPSAVITHGNTAIQPGETRRSITQYNSSGLFGWTAHGNMPFTQAKKTEVKEWWTKPRHRFSKLSDLVREAGVKA